VQWVLETLELRAYRDAYHAVRRARSERDMPRGPMVDLVLDVQAELAKRRLADG
jgi:hypothetical protein